MNPGGEAWLPILHTRRDGRDYTALYSNTPLAHRLDRTHDWVVIYPENGASQRPFTVVTERRGALAGKRVVRGLERECREAYGAAEGAAA
jgi:putative hydrolase